MRVLLDENVPRDLAAAIAGHEVSSVQALGWSGTSNGELLQRAAQRFDVLVTMDRGLQHQQNPETLGVGVLILRARSNRMPDLEPLVGSVLRALPSIRPGDVVTIGA